MVRHYFPLFFLIIIKFLRFGGFFLKIHDAISTLFSLIFLIVEIKNAQNFQLLNVYAASFCDVDLRRCGEEWLSRVKINDSGGSLNINSLKLQLFLFYFGRFWIILRLINDFCVYQKIENSETSFWHSRVNHRGRIRKGREVPQIILWLFKAVHSINHEV